MKEYKWIAHKGGSWRFLEDMVTEHLNDNWELVGSPFYFGDRNNKDEWWIQAMVRETRAIMHGDGFVSGYDYSDIVKEELTKRGLG